MAAVQNHFAYLSFPILASVMPVKGQGNSELVSIGAGAVSALHLVHGSNW
jgi:hypothetical protein